MKKLLIIIGVTVGLNTSIVADPIHDAAATGDLEGVLAELDKEGVDVDTGSGNGETPLWLAAYNGHNKIVEVLIARGADLEAKNYFRGRGALNNGRTAVFAALNSKELMTLLIAGGADLNATADSLRETVLHILASQSESESIMELIELVINNGGNVNALTTLYASKTTTQAGMGTPTDIALFERNFETAKLIRKYGGKTTGEVIESLQNKTVALEKLISEKHKSDTPNPTDEWPRKMWEIGLGEPLGPLNHIIGVDNSIVFKTGRDSHWVTKEGKSFRIQNTIIRYDDLVYLDNKNLIYKTYGNREISVNLLTRNDELVALNQINIKNLEITEFPRNSGHIGLSKDGTKITAWDFTPPTLASTDNDGGNGGGNETANSRLIIKTAGPDIALATDGKLGAAELQKSNDLRSWRRLGDVPAEASEVLVTPREGSNEFYRLKKK